MWPSSRRAIRSVLTAQRRSNATLQKHRDDPTLKHLLIGKHTRVIYQGFTGRVASTNARDSIAYGTNIVGGVTLGKDGEHLGLPVLPSVRRAKDELKPDATAIFVPATGAAAAIEEAIEAEIPLIVAVAEHIPIHEMLRISEVLRTTGKSRLVGANSPGIIAPLSSCRIGFQPLPMYRPGHVGVIAKSGTLSYEAVASLTRAGLGQSLCIGAGGDVVSGTSLFEGYLALLDDPQTHGIVVIGEEGGKIEESIATWMRTDDRAKQSEKPVVGLIAGRTTPPIRVMGHAGAFLGPHEPRAEDKRNSLISAGATVVNHPEQIGVTMKGLLQKQTTSKSQARPSQPGSTRSFHTLRKTVTKWNPISSPSQQQRLLHLHGKMAKQILEPVVSDFHCHEDEETDAGILMCGLTFSIDRLHMTRTLSCTSIDTRKGASATSDVLGSPIDLGSQQSANNAAAFKHLGEQIHRHHQRLGMPKSTDLTPVLQLAEKLANFVATHDIISLSVAVDLASLGGRNRTIHRPRIHIDDSALKTAGRQKEIFALREPEKEEPAEVEAEKYGIVYVKLHPEDETANIGTLVNGAGLAMNTVDVLSLDPYHGKCTNFLDTGGKATSETVKKSFELVLSDPRVKVIFVNIFGGLTDCGMIADGIMLAFKEVDMRGIPVVVRLRGTNEEAGQDKIAQSGLDLEAFDGFADAAKRVMELAKRGGNDGQGVKTTDA